MRFKEEELQLPGDEKVRWKVVLKCSEHRMCIRSPVEVSFSLTLLIMMSKLQKLKRFTLGEQPKVRSKLYAKQVL